VGRQVDVSNVGEHPLELTFDREEQNDVVIVQRFAAHPFNTLRSQVLLVCELPKIMAANRPCSAEPSCQYALRKRALELGWGETSIRILDRNLGVSGGRTTGRADFKTLVADV
jgi:hypothetical protein